MAKLRVEYNLWEHMDIEITQAEAIAYLDGMYSTETDALMERVYEEAERRLRPKRPGLHYEWLEDNPELLDFVKPEQLELF